tara:strand:- start:362 stop:1822 length:1461 start_codon:yes stop_codon:yes gene_type:complete
MVNTVQPVILCGGAGSRLWPLSRTGYPKQFLCLNQKYSLFQLSVQRLTNLGPYNQPSNNPLIVTNEEHRFLVSEQLREIDVEPEKIILEPEGKNTAPALTLAALSSRAEDDPILIVSPADQTIQSLDNFEKSITQAVELATEDSIVILGVPPESPETGYGYINVGERPKRNQPYFNVQSFMEKPNIEVAKNYIEAGTYFWNAGMFILKSSVWLKAIKRFSPTIAETCIKAWGKKEDDDYFVRPNIEQFKSIPSDSIDYAVVEHCPGKLPIKMVPLKAGWNDLGSWDAVWQVGDKDKCGNVSTGDVVISEANNNLIFADNRLVTLVDVDNLVVIETSDAVLVANKSESQNVKNIVDKLALGGREEHSVHRKVYRPWGWFDSVDEGDRFIVKRIQVKPGASLSLQKHQHRAEHWIVVKGTAEIICGEKKLTLSENQSTYIPLGEKHRLSNPYDTPLEIVEVQSGSYLGEDDIVRFEDHYGREKSNGES